MSNIIMRPVYNRPEMLRLSIDYEIDARKKFDGFNDMVTMFIVEHGSPAQTHRIVDSYPYDKIVQLRPRKFGLTVNILEGMKQAFSKADDFVIYIEDDILIHETYFEYMNCILNMNLDVRGEFSVLSAYNFNNNGDVSKVRKGQHYAALAPLINKKFFVDYILPCANPDYYSNRSNFVIKLNDKYKEYWGKRYKYVNNAHNEQAGLINRLVDISAIENDMFVIMPFVNRQIHIGFYGKNRPGRGIPGDSFTERLDNLKNIINENKLYEMTEDKRYNDYLTFSDKLNEWNGSITF